ncbi:MAG TPA: hypothetical protein VFJ74_10510 [Gemmatimonadaceae bacterium]|nr:hypothetical protein [Gemmatimonadaceae bacterium]
MTERHLTPDEIDLLLDGEVGFGVAPLKAHVRRCAECRAELDEARALTAALEHLPHFAPSPLFAERVMERVQVFEPAHVAVADVARRWLPQSRPARILAGAAAGGLGLVLSFLTLWLGARLDVLVFFGDLVAERAGRVVVGALSDTIGAAFGQPAAEALRLGGTAGVAIALTALLLAVALAALGLRAVAGASAARRHRA